MEVSFLHSNIRILLIEDNPDDHRLIIKMLRGKTRQFSLIQAINLTDGLALMRGNDFDVVLLDLGLPESTGLDTLRKVSPFAHPFPIIVLSGLDDESTGEIAVREGAQDYLIKGKVNTELLCRSIRHAIERKRAEIALEASEKRYRRLHDTLREAFAYVDMQGRLIDFNKAYVDMLGYLPDELRGLTYNDLTPEKWHLSEANIVNGQVLVRGHSDVYEKEYRKKDGTVFPVELRTYLIKDESGNPASMWAIVRDITEKKNITQKLEKALAESSATSNYLNSIINAVADPIFVKDRQHRWVFLNNAYCALKGRSRDELLGKSIYDVDPKAEADVMWQDDEAVFNTGAEHVREGKRTDSKGNVHFTVTKKTLFKNDRGGEFIVGVVRDITERKHTEDTLRASEERFSLAMDATKDGLWDWNVKTGTVYYSPGYIAMLGYASGEFPGHVSSWTDLIHPEDKEFVFKTNMDCIENRRDDFEIEFRMRAKSGEWRWMLGRGKSVFRDNSGQATQIVGTHTDISGRKHTETQLKESLSIKRATLESTADGILVVNKQAKVADYNNKLMELWNIPPDLLEQKDDNQLLQYISGQLLYPEVFVKKVRELYNNPDADDFDEIPFKDGRIFECYSIPHRLEGKSIGRVWSFRDITKRKRAEEALHESEERYKALFDRSLDCVFLIDFEGHFLDANQASLDLVGYRREDILELTFVQLLAADQYMLAIQTIDEIKATGHQKSPTEFQLRRKDGRNVFVETQASLIYRDGKPYAIQGIARDITDRKRAEEALRTERQHLIDIIDFLPDATFVINTERQVVAWNRAAESMTGVHRNELLGKGDYAYAEPFFGERFPVLIDFLDTPDDVREKSYKYIRRSGSMIYAESFIQRLNGGRGMHLWGVAAPLYDRNGNRTGSIGVTRDVTDYKLAEEEKIQLQAQLLQAQKIESVGRLAGGVAHDFNNMLSAILGHAELAMHKCTPSDPIHADLKVIEQSAVRSGDLTRQLLAFARKQAVVPKVLDMNDTVSGMLKMLRRLIGEDIDLIWKPGASVWPVRIDPSQIDQILANLCVNARDAIAGVGKLAIETRNAVVDQAACASHPGFLPGDYVMLTVNDDGCGMDKDVLDHIFEPFFTTKEVGKGTGLGLAMVYGIVKQNDGYIDVVSDSDKGSTFKIYLPRFAGNIDEPLASGDEEMPRGHGETVLLVEDEALILNANRAILEALGYTVVTASTPGEALRQAKAHAGEIQLLLTDVVMPEMNGRDLAKVLGEIIPGLKCLFSSGYTADIIARRGVLDEGVHFLQKPFSMKDLAAKIREGLQQK